MGGALRRGRYSRMGSPEKTIGNGGSLSRSSISSSVTFELFCADEPLLKAGELSIGLDGRNGRPADIFVYGICRPPEGEIAEV